MTVATEGGATTLSAEQRGWVDRARAELDRTDLGALVLAMTAIPSPTGEEAALAEFLAGHLAGAGVDARVQPVGGGQANAIGRLAGDGSGPTLLLYSGIDTPFGGGSAEDQPWLGDGPRADWALPPTGQDGKVIGLGADNPKGFAAALVAAAEAVARASVPLRGDVWIALASGSMPVRGGLGTGISAVLDEIGRPDFAILVKPGYAVAHEEVGFAWFRITVRGALNYTGIRHKGPYRNPILAAATVVTELEAWFAQYTAANTSGLVAPQGSINAIQAGSPDRLAFVPATAQIDLDLRLGPRTTADEAEAQLREALDRITTAHPDIELDVERVIALPGTATGPESWIVRSLVAAWEEREGREHVPLKNGSGASDATIIRAQGIPAARIGPPPPATPNPYPGFSMGQADVASLRGLAELLIRAIVDTGSRSRAEVGL